MIDVDAMSPDEQEALARRCYIRNNHIYWGPSGGFSITMFEDIWDADDSEGKWQGPGLRAREVEQLIRENRELKALLARADALKKIGYPIEIYENPHSGDWLIIAPNPLFDDEYVIMQRRAEGHFRMSSGRSNHTRDKVDQEIRSHMTIEIGRSVELAR